MGEVLSRELSGIFPRLANASKTLDSTEIRLSKIEKELFPIERETKYLRPYLFGRKF